MIVCCFSAQVTRWFQETIILLIMLNRLRLWFLIQEAALTFETRAKTVEELSMGYCLKCRTPAICHWLFNCDFSFTSVIIKELNAEVRKCCVKLTHAHVFYPSFAHTLLSERAISKLCFPSKPHSENFLLICTLTLSKLQSLWSTWQFVRWINKGTRSFSWARPRRSV